MYTFDALKTRIEAFRFEADFDMVVAVANGGIIPAAMLNQRLDKEFNILKINLRDAQQRPRFDAPRLLEPVNFEARGKRILLVEDRVKSGASLALAKQTLLEAGALSVKTFAVNGKADYSLLDVPCFRFPWIVSVD